MTDEATATGSRPDADPDAAADAVGSARRGGVAALTVAQQKPTFLRLKRRRDLDAPENLILEAPAQVKKARPIDALLAHLAAVDISSTNTGTTDTLPGRRRRKFCRITTIQASALHQTPAEVEQFLSALQVDKAARRAAMKDATAHHAGLDSFKKRQRDAAVEAGRIARYQQVRQRRTGAAKDEEGVAPQTVEHDAWKQLFHVYDIEAVPEDAAQQGDSSASQRKASEEAAILRDYMPMVRDYLGLTDTDLAPAPEPAQPAKATGQGQAASVREEEWVFDVYVPVEGTWEEMHEDSSAEAPAPVVQVAEDEDQLYWEAQDEEDDELDSEDSNAENYYAASYPDEEDAEDDDVEDDPDGLHYMYPDMRAARRRGDSEEEYYNDSSEEDEGHNGRTRGYFR